MGHVSGTSALPSPAWTIRSPPRPSAARLSADITYGTNNEFGFDYLRDNMVFSPSSGSGSTRRDHRRGRFDFDRRSGRRSSSRAGGNEADDKNAHQPAGRGAGAEADRRRHLLAEAEKLLEDDKTRQEAALKLYQAQLGMPKNKRLLKMQNETGIKQLVQRMELDAIADRKLPIKQQRMRDLEDTLYFVLDEKGHSVHLTDRGAEAMSPNDPELFLVPDISEAIHRIDHDPALSSHERLEQRRGVEAEYALNSEKLTSSMLPQARV
jgi:preprotein translocase subunit SecA